MDFFRAALPASTAHAPLPHRLTLEEARSAVASTTPPPNSASTLAARVIWALGPRRYGGALTPARLAGILGDPQRPGCGMPIEQVVAILRQLKQDALVTRDARRGTYQLCAEVMP